GLEVEWESTLTQGWLTLRVRGEDSEAFGNLLRKQMGEAPVEIAKVEKWDILKGYITGAGRVGFGVYIDVGVLHPRPKDDLYLLYRRSNSYLVSFLWMNPAQLLPIGYTGRGLLFTLTEIRQIGIWGDYYFP